ncbi:helix-turn-helix domain-containing protein [Enterococcus plantarum]|uniref:helix-turn-helix domain-containing protein n=1 Tax=Enterococcus plantarum TaxID=1077675 RepID=UPI001A8CF2E9|nr:helix-turn-helix domain-containing protein [Enterococcus plantarum]MBO0422180.1 helix-turn-helix domain-containing protein [Enterococcus plantarum]
MNFGPTIKKIRVAKNISQETLSKGIMERSNLSRFENGHYSPSYTVIPLLLERLNMDYEELIFLAKNYQISSLETLNTKIMQAINTYDKTALICLSQEACKQSKISTNIQYRHLYLLTLAFLQKYFNIKEHAFNIDMLIHTEILSYFTKTDSWYIYEFRLLNNFLHYFNHESILYLLPMAEQQLIKYTKMQNTHSLHQHLWQNAGIYFFEKKEYKNALHYFEKAICLSNSKRLLFEKIEATIYHQLCLNTQSDEPFDIEIYLSILDQFGFDKSASHLKKIMNRIN